MKRVVLKTSSPHQKRNAFHWEQDGTNGTCCYREDRSLKFNKERLKEQLRTHWRSRFPCLEEKRSSSQPDWGRKVETFPIEILRNEKEPGVTEKTKFDYRDVKISRALPGHFGPLGFRSSEKKTSFLKQRLYNNKMWPVVKTLKEKIEIVEEHEKF